MPKVFVLSAIIALTVFPQHFPGNSSKKADQDPSFLFTFKSSNTINPFECKEKKTVDTNALKQSNWYAEATRYIEASEYEIKKQDGNLFAAPNRQQQLKASFSYNNFILQPRSEERAWQLQMQVNGIYADKKLIIKPDGNDLPEVNSNKIVFNNSNFLTEYINSKEGVRQNFIINKKPVDPCKKIIVQLSTNKGWYINKVHDKELHFAAIKNGRLSQKITYNGLKAWDATNKELVARFVVNKKHTAFDIEVNTLDATYPITIDPISTTASAIVESNQANAWMGFSVSSAGDVNGDGYSDIIVGSHNYDSGEIDEGAVFIYHGSATGINITAAAMIQSNQTGALMGISVSAAGDVNGDGYSDIIAGAQLYDSGENNEGAAFIYHGSAAGINTTAATMVQSNQALSQLGLSVAGAGDVNGDGYSDVIAGAWLYSNGEGAEGRAFIYHGSATGINNIAATTVESNQVNANLGIAVAGAGDVNGDGYNDVIAGAQLYDNGQTDEGAAFIYHGSASGINNVAVTMVESNQAFCQFGYSVSSAGDVNGDGYSDVIAGAYTFDNGEINEGAAFVYHGTAGGINNVAAATVESGQVNANFGTSVACAGDVNGDGYSDVIVGAILYDNGQTDEGAAFVYFGSTTGLNNVAMAILESNQANAQMGRSIASAGDINGDGYSDVIAGVVFYDNGETDEGGAFTYHGSAEGVFFSIPAILQSNQVNAQMGYSVNSAGDVNGDGYSDVIVGVPSYDNTEIDEGAAFIYHGSPTGTSTIPAAILQSNITNLLMGQSVSSAGDVNGDGYSDVIVGASGYDNVQTDEGAAFIYHGSAAGINTTVAAILQSNITGAFMGFSVAPAGDVNGDGYSDVIAGAPFYDNGQSAEGAAFIYLGAATGVSLTPVAIVESNQVAAIMGYSVSAAGDVNGDGYSDVIAGAFSYDNVEGDEGAVFVYHGTATGINTTPQIIESNLAGIRMGWSVSFAGDVNGDGYGDIIAGAQDYSNVENQEGAVFVYHGAATGLSTTPSAILQSNRANTKMGVSVSAAGDVNGDGYSDIIAGSTQYTNVENGEGAIFIFHGSSTGLALIPAAIIESNQSDANMGVSVASAGDINGDGYSDVIAGIYLYDNVETDEGGVFIYDGNTSVLNKQNNLRLYNTDLATPINSSNFLLGNFGAGLFAKSFLGRGKGKLVWETRLNYNAYSGTPITNSTFFTAQQAGYSDLGIAGSELKNIISKISGSGKFTKLRARIKYNPATAITGQVYGPWRYVSPIIDGNLMGALPIELISFNAEWIQKGKTAALHFSTDKESGTCCFDIEKSLDGFNFNTIGIVAAKNSGGLQSYSFNDNTAINKKQFYRLKIKGNNGQVEYSNMQQLQNNIATEILVLPNPVIDVLQLQLNKIYGKMNIQIINASGQVVKQFSVIPVADQILKIPVAQLASGNYWLSLQSGAEKQTLQFMKK